MKNVFNQADVAETIARLQQLTPTSQPLWGKMTVGQMLAHCNVTYEMIFENIHPKANFLMRFILTTFVKNIVVGEKPFKKNSQTAPEFIMKESKDFEKEKARLLAYIKKTEQVGTAFFEGKESLSFGVLTVQEWNNLMYKHLDHHFQQFGV